jgi:hypothetical protein
MRVSARLNKPPGGLPRSRGSQAIASAGRQGRGRGAQPGPPRAEQQQQAKLAHSGAKQGLLLALLLLPRA